MAPILPWIQEYLGPGPLTVKRQNVEVLGLGPIVAGVQVALLVLCTAAVGLRVWARGWVFRHAKVWGWDDTLTVLGYLTFAASCVFFVLAARNGLGTPDARLADVEAGFRRPEAAVYTSYGQMQQLASTNLAKAGIAMGLLRLTSQRRHRWPLWGLILAPPAFAGGTVVYLASACRPLSTQWHWDGAPATPDHPVSCSIPERQTLVQLAYVYTALTVALDCACAAVPCLLLRDLQMHGRVKASLLGLLAFGAVAALCALARVPHIWHYYDPEHDLMYNIASVFLWSSAENAIGLVAACLPPIHKLYNFYGGNGIPNDGVGGGGGGGAGGDQMNMSQGGDNNRAGATETIGGTPLSKCDGTDDGGGGGGGGALTVGGEASARAQSRAGSRSARRSQRQPSDLESLGSGSGRWHELDNRGSSRENIVRSETTYSI